MITLAAADAQRLSLLRVALRREFPGLGCRLMTTSIGEIPCAGASIIIGGATFCTRSQPVFRLSIDAVIDGIKSILNP